MYKPESMRSAGVVSLLLSLVSCSVLAQSVNDRCSTIGDADFLLRHYQGLFVDDGASSFRDRLGLRQLGAEDEIAVATETGTCSRVVAQARKVIRKQLLGPKAARPQDFEHAVLEYGPYLAVYVEFVDPEGAVLQDNSLLLVFDGETVEFLGWTRP